VALARSGDDSQTIVAARIEPLLTVHTKRFYRLGESASCIAQTATDIFLLFYLTAVVGLSGTLAGPTLFIGTASPIQMLM
jgi:hypothetical protein